MTDLQLAVTNAGRAALTNAQGNGTNAVTVASIGVTATSFAADASTAAVPGEIKRIATIAGGPVAADTIHVTIRDDSADTYSLRGLGVYLDDGTLFAVFSQAAVLVEKSAQATLILACDWQFADIDAASLTFGDTNFQLNQATTETTGIVELATDAEAATGADAQRAVTPKSLLAALNARLGAGAPSVFVKGLLTAATAAVFRTALAIKGAALKDEGAGNGLDADTVDGQHGAFYLAWANQTGVPASFPPSAHTHQMSEIVNLISTLGTKANLDSPPLTGVPTAPTASTLSNSTQLATTAFVQARIGQIINNSPAALDTLKELADALGDDPNFATTVTNSLANKADKLTAGLNNTAGTSAEVISAYTDSLNGKASLRVLRGSNSSSTGWVLRTASAGAAVDAAIFNPDGSVTIAGGVTATSFAGLVNHTSGYLTIGSFSAAYGAGSCRLYYDANNNRLVLNTSITASNIGSAASAAIGDFATAAQGVKADNALPKTGGAVAGSIAASGGVSGILSHTSGYLNIGSYSESVYGAGNCRIYYSANDDKLVTGSSMALNALAASGAITGASVRATGTIMAAGGFQIG